MSQDKKKVTAVESAQAWTAKHSAEGLDLKTLHAAITAVEKKTKEAHAAAAQLGEILIARKEAVKLMKKALKDAKAARKLGPVKAPAAAPKPAAPRSAPKKAVPKKASSPKTK
jgi:hypothetical protein